MHELVSRGSRGKGASGRMAADHVRDVRRTAVLGMNWDGYLTLKLPVPSRPPGTATVEGHRE